MTTFTSGFNASSFLPTLYMFYNGTSVNSFADSQSVNSSMSALQQTTNLTEVHSNRTDYESTFNGVTTSVTFQNMTSSLSPSSSFHSAAGGSTGSVYSETFSSPVETDFTTDFTSAFPSAHAHSVYTQTMLQVGSYGSDAVTAASTQVANLQQLTGGHYYAAGIVIGALALLFILSAFGLLVCRRRMMTYHSLTSGSARSYDYLYRPLNKAGRLDDEYDHTFVGVSIPLLQEVTIV